MRQYIERFRVAHELAPVQTVRSRQSHKSTFATFAGVAFVLSIAAVVVLWAVGKHPDRFEGQLDPSTENAAESTPATSSRVALTAPTPRLVLTASPLLGSDEELPLGLSVQGGSDGMGITVGGLMAGTTVTAGRASGADGWWLGFADVDGARIKRPPGYVGTMHLAVELRLADGSVADRQSLPIDWTLPPHAEVTGAKPEAVVAATPNMGATTGPMRGEELPVGAAAILDAETIAALLRRADAFVEVGDISAARVLLRRAAESGDPRAALALGATYDPIALAKRGVQGLVADVTAARTWYDRAKQFGSEEAQGRIDQLASQRR